MAFIIDMPKLSDTMEEGGIAKWLKKEGDVLKEGEAFVEIETDKATMEYEAPRGGTLLKILVPAGKTSALNAPIAVVGEKGESYDLDALIAAAAPKAGGHGKPPAPAIPATPASKSAAPAVPQPTAVKAEAPAQALKLSESASKAPGGRVRSSPLARKVAKEKGIDLAQVQGSGPQGRVIVRDLDQAPAAGSASAVVRAPIRSGVVEDRVIPLTMMRKTIAKRLLAGKNEAPHFYLTVSADMGPMLTWREQLNAEAEKSKGSLAKVSVNDLVILAVSRSLRMHPGVNASWEGDAIREWGHVHVAMAVALPTGLVTPVVRDTDLLNVREIAALARDLATRAKDGKLGNEDYAGGTFTISNLGMFGIEGFTAIINPPQSAILAVGGVMKVPAVNSSGQVVVQSRMTMTMSCDHRVIDGAMGAQFLQTLVKFLEDPVMMLA